MTEHAGALAAIVYERGFDLDSFLGTVCARLTGAGYRLGGLLQATTGARDGCASSIQVVDLRTANRHEIWEDRGPCARGCRLDERGLTAAAPAIADAIAAGVDLVVINRFGRAESRGGGLLPPLAAAIEAGIPVLTAVREPYVDAWRAFHGGLGEDLPSRTDHVLRWCSRTIDACANPPAAPGSFDAVTTVSAK